MGTEPQIDSPCGRTGTLPSMDGNTRRLTTREMGRTPSLGDRAPKFRLRRTFDDEVSLDGLLSTGPVLLAFYVFDFGHV